jgi:hypothetical protein
MALHATICVSSAGQSHRRQTASAMALHATVAVSPSEQLHRRQTVSCV